MIEVINREREGYEVDQDCLKTLVEMLCTVGDNQPKVVKTKGPGDERLFWQSCTKGFYKNDFETQLLTATAAYYKTKVTGWFAMCSCAQFLEEVRKSLDDEESRLTHYLDRSSEQELKTVAQNELIKQTGKTLVEMES